MTDGYPQRRFVPPPGSTQVVLVRHGASAEAVPGDPFDLLDGHADPPLAPEGREQAEAAARRPPPPAARAGGPGAGGGGGPAPGERANRRAVRHAAVPDGGDRGATCG